MYKPYVRFWNGKEYTEVNLSVKYHRSKIHAQYVAFYSTLDEYVRTANKNLSLDLDEREIHFFLCTKGRTSDAQCSSHNLE